MSAVRRIWLVVLGWFIILCSAAALPSVQAADSVRAIVISGEIDGSQAALVRRGLELAEETGDTAVVVSIDTMGGRADSALKIRDMLRSTSLPTIAFVKSRAWSAGALIALSCRHIVMAPGSSIGAAEPIPNTEKNIAAMKSEFSATASHMGHNPRVAEAMVDKTHGYPDYAEPGEILSLSDGQAKELGISEGTANSPEEALKLFSLGDASVQYEEKSWKDSIIGMHHRHPAERVRPHGRHRPYPDGDLCRNQDGRHRRRHHYGYRLRRPAVLIRRGFTGRQPDRLRRVYRQSVLRRDGNPVSRHGAC